MVVVVWVVAVVALVMALVWAMDSYASRRRAVAELEVARNRLRHVLGCAPAVIYTARPDGDHVTTFVSDGVRALLGYEPEVFVNQPGSWIARVHPDDRPAAAAWLDSVVEIGHGTHDYRFERADGTWRWMREEVRLSRDAAGRPLEIVGYWADITERRETEERLAQANKLEAVGTLAAGVSHDFNNILMGIMGCTDMALDRIPGGHPLRLLLLEMRDSAEAGVGIVRQLLDFAHRGPQPPVRVTFDEHLGRRSQLLRRLVGHRHTLVLRLEANGEQVVVDPAQLDQLLVNLVVNAKNAMTDGGQLEIETQVVVVDPRHHPRMRGLVEGNHVLLTVRDQGCGMDEATRARAFEPFFTTKPVGQGTGLGLSLVYAVVQRAGGTIQLDSKPGAGTTFRIYLPSAGCLERTISISGPLEAAPGSLEEAPPAQVPVRQGERT